MKYLITLIAIVLFNSNVNANSRIPVDSSVKVYQHYSNQIEQKFKIPVLQGIEFRPKRKLDPFEFENLSFRFKTFGFKEYSLINQKINLEKKLFFIQKQSEISKILYNQMSKFIQWQFNHEKITLLQEAIQLYQETIEFYLKNIHDPNFDHNLYYQMKIELLEYINQNEKLTRFNRLLENQIFDPGSAHDSLIAEKEILNSIQLSKIIPNSPLIASLCLQKEIQQVELDIEKKKNFFKISYFQAEIEESEKYQDKQYSLEMGVELPFPGKTNQSKISKLLNLIQIETAIIHQQNLIHNRLDSLEIEVSSQRNMIEKLNQFLKQIDNDQKNSADPSIYFLTHKTRIQTQIKIINIKENLYQNWIDWLHDQGKLKSHNQLFELPQEN